MSWIAIGVTAAGAAGTMGAAAINKSGGGKYKEIANRFGSLEKPITDFYAERIGKPGPTYPGGGEAAVAPMSDEEKQSLDFLKQFGQGDIGTTGTAAKAQIEKTLTSQFDPTTSPYYQALKAESARNLEETQRGIADVSAGTTGFHTGARRAEQSRAVGERGIQLDKVMAMLADKERDRALSVIPQALQFEDTERRIPLEKATAFQSLGGLPRGIEQAMKSFDVSQFQQSEIDYPNQIAQMISALLTGNQPVLEQGGPSGLESALGGVGQAGGEIGTALLMQKLLESAKTPKVGG